MKKKAALARNTSRDVTLDQAREDALLLLKQRPTPANGTIGKASQVILTAALLISANGAVKKRPEELLNSLLYGNADDEVVAIVESCAPGAARQFCRTALGHLRTLPPAERSKVIKGALNPLSYASHLAYSPHTRT